MRSGAKIMCRISAGRRSNCDGSAAVSSSLAGVGIVEVGTLAAVQECGYVARQ